MWRRTKIAFTISNHSNANKHALNASNTAASEGREKLNNSDNQGICNTSMSAKIVSPITHV
jgi:hypothetical protein